VLRLRLLYRLSRERLLEARWLPLLAECTLQVPSPIPPLAKRDTEAFLVLWCRTQESVRGDAQARLRELGRRVGVEAQAERLFGARSLRRRILGTIALGHVGSRKRLRDMEALLPDGPPAVALSAAQALLRIEGERALSSVLTCAARRDDWPLSTVASILKEVDAAQVAPRLAAVIESELRHAGAPASLARLLRLHPSAQAEALRPAVVAVLSSCQDADALAAALGAVIHPDDLAHVRRLLEHGEWAVRVAAARALARLGEKSDFPRLAARLADASWWVRHRAAQALCNLPGVARSELEALARCNADKFAADALIQALAERPA
jgi:HEAT repeat protein